MKKNSEKIINAAVVVPTLNAGSVWCDWIDALLITKKDVNDIYIIDSSSSDDTVSLSCEAGFNVDKINPASFNHGGTRQSAVDRLDDYEVVVFLTQDAILASPDSIDDLLKAFEDPMVGAAYGRQLPRRSASLIEAHSRLFNYTNKSRVNSFEDAKELGMKTAFMSNSFAAYRRSALHDVGGFPTNSIVSEDMYAAARMLMQNWKIAYCADAQVYHSHGYSIFQEFQRYFDIGVFNARESWIREAFGQAEPEGGRFVRSELKFLLLNNPLLLPASILRTCFKLLGYKFGINESLFPVSVKRAFSMQKNYWN